MPNPDTSSAEDLRWLDAAARLAGRARPQSRPNPAVGAIIVTRGRVVGRGWTQPGGRPHAEAMALVQAGKAAVGGTLYVTLEPCAHPSERGPTCANLTAASGLSRIVIGCEDPDPRTAGAGLAHIRERGVTADLVASTAACGSLAGYFTRLEHGRPHVTLKLATSLDGQIALADGTSRWITGEAARAHCHVMRAQADAILVGGATLRHDAPRLDVRLPGLEDRSPERWVLTRDEPPPGWQAIHSPSAISGMSGLHYLFVEGGAQTAAAFLAADLVDRILLYRAPIVIGHGKSAIGDIGLHDLATAHGRWTLADTRRLGSDTLEVYERT